jgi:hypothetical protein
MQAVEVSRGGRSQSTGLERDTYNPDLAHSLVRPRSTERVAAPVSKGVLKKEPPPSADQRGGDYPSWMFWRAKQGTKKSGFDKTRISPPVAVQVPIVPSFQRPHAPKPSRPGRPTDLLTVQLRPDGAREIPGSQTERLADIKICRENLGTASLCFGSHPPELPVDRPANAYQPDLAQIAQCETLGRFVQVELDEVVPHRSRQRDSLSAFSTTAVVNDDLAERLDEVSCNRHRSSDDDDSSTTEVLDESPDAPIGVAVSDYTSFPEPPFEEPEAELSTKQARRRGMLFSSEEFCDPASFAGVEYDDDNQFEDAGFENTGSEGEPQVIEAPPSAPSPVPDILITPPSRDSSMQSRDQRDLLSVEHAWKRIADRASRQAKMNKEELENLRAYTAPLMAAFDVVMNHPEFSYLDTWDGVEEVLLKILEERDTNALERDMAIRAARWFEREWRALVERTRALEEETED